MISAYGRCDLIESLRIHIGRLTGTTTRGWRASKLRGRLKLWLKADKASRERGVRRALDRSTGLRGVARRAGDILHEPDGAAPAGRNRRQRPIRFVRRACARLSGFVSSYDSLTDQCVPFAAGSPFRAPRSNNGRFILDPTGASNAFRRARDPFERSFQLDARMPINLPQAATLVGQRGGARTPLPAAWRRTGSSRRRGST